MAKGKTQMSTVVTPAGPSVEKSVIRKTIMTADLDDVLILKEFTFTPVSDPSEASARIGNDPAKFLKVLNAGLRSLERETLSESNEGWFAAGEDGKITASAVSGESAGDPTAIAAIINNFAKVSTPNWASLNAAQKNEKRDLVRKLLKENKPMLDMLKASASSSSESE